MASTRHGAVIWALIVACLIALTSSATKRARISSSSSSDRMSKEWVNVTEFWCFPDNLPEVMIDNVYECFRLYKGNKEFEAQIRCENELIPLNNTKNDVRRKLCKNDKKAVTLFEKCFVKNGVIVTRTTNGGSRTATSASRSQLSKFRDLISCMKKALKWDELNQGQNTTVAVDDPED